MVTRDDGEPVEVRRDENDEPIQFVWHDRLYLVRGVLAHWVESTPWWSSPTTSGMPADIGERDRVRPEPPDGASRAARTARCAWVPGWA